MGYIVNFNNFNESRGISDSSEKVTNSIWFDIENHIKSKNYFFKYFTFIETDFKIKDIQIEFIFTKGSKNVCYAVTNFNDSELEELTLNKVKIKFEIEFNEVDDPFLYYIKSVLLHEILHVFQYYNLKINNKFRPESFSIGSIIPQIRKYIKTKYVNYILDILYFSLKHEISAQLHQYYMYKMDGKEYTRIHEIKKMLNQFSIKELDIEEENELNIVRKHILNSIKYFTRNKKYNIKSSKSIWSKNNNEFLKELSNLVKDKIKWIDKKIKLVDGKNIIDYSENFTYYGDLNEYKHLRSFCFISKYLNDCPLIENV